MMKCYEYEYNVGNSPDTELMFVYAESDEEAASALSAYGDEVTANDLSEVDTNGRYFKAWARRYGRHYNVYHVEHGELVGRGSPTDVYDSYREYTLDQIVG